MHVYEVLKRPVVTEKTMIATDDHNKVTFEVDMRANKLQIKDAVETAFAVDVVDVHVMVPGCQQCRRSMRQHLHPVLTHRKNPYCLRAG